MIPPLPDDARIARLRSACADGSPVDPDRQAAIVALTLTRCDLEKSPRDLTRTKAMVEQMMADLVFPLGAA